MDYGDRLVDEKLLVIDKGNRCVGSVVEDTVNARFAVRFPRCLASTGALFPGTAGRACAEDRLKSAASGEAASTQLGYHVVLSQPAHALVVWPAASVFLHCIRGRASQGSFLTHTRTLQ